MSDAPSIGDEQFRQPESNLPAPPESLRFRRRIAAVVFISLIGGGVALRVALSRPRPVAETTMPDGTILTLRAVTTGRQHSLARAIPASIVQWMGADFDRSVSRETSADSLVLWFSRRDPSTGEPLSFDWWLRCSVDDANGWEVEDDDAEEYEIARGAPRVGTFGRRPFDAVDASNLRDIIATSVLPRFRCSRETFRLKVFDVAGMVVAEFEVPLTEPVSAPIWTPEPLPVSKVVGDLTVTLRSFDLRGTDFVSGDRAALLVSPDVEFSQEDQSVDWTVGDVQFRDALGNTSDELWDGSLSPFETAWRMTLKVRPAAEELQTRQMERQIEFYVVPPMRRLLTSSQESADDPESEE